jgi:hypothetical protein
MCMPVATSSKNTEISCGPVTALGVVHIVPAGPEHPVYLPELVLGVLDVQMLHELI